jgi:hypothetical protein
MVNVLRFKGGNDLAGLVDQAGSHNKRFDIYGGANDPENAGEPAGVEAEPIAAGK